VEPTTESVGSPGQGQQGTLNRGQVASLQLAGLREVVEGSPKTNGEKGPKHNGSAELSKIAPLHVRLLSWEQQTCEP
jgi:hypothetical protein